MSLIGQKTNYLRITPLLTINIDTASSSDVLRQIEHFSLEDYSVRDFVIMSKQMDQDIYNDDQKLRKLAWDCAALMGTLVEEVTPPGSYYSIPERYRLNFWGSDRDTLITYIGLLCQVYPSAKAFVMQDLAYFKRQYPLPWYKRLVRSKYELKHLTWTQLINLAVRCCQLTASYKGNPL